MLADYLWVLLFALPVVLLAGWVHGALGLGFPLVATSILAVAVDLRLVIFVTLLPTVVVNAASVATSESVLDTARRYSLLVVASLLGATVGAYVISITDPSPFRLLLAALIVLFLVNSLFKIKLKLRSDFVAMIVFGLVAGFAGGATNVMVAVLIIYFISINAPRSEMVPAMNMCFLTGKLSQIAVFLLRAYWVLSYCFIPSLWR